MRKQLEKYFDMMAIIIRIILENKVFSDKEFQSVLNDTDTSLYIDLVCKFPELVRDNKTFKNVEIRQLNEAFFHKIDKSIQQKNVYILMLLLYYMDRAIGTCYNNLIGFEDDVEIFNALNSNWRNTQIALVKKTKCRWEPKQIGNGLKGILSNFYYIDYKNLMNIEIVHHVLDANLIRRDEMDTLKLALSPVTKAKTVEFSDPYIKKNSITGADQKYFRVENVIDEDMITKQVMENICIAGENHTDILVFPEMIGTEKMLEKILRDLSCVGKEKLPALIVFPSIWEKTENDYNNINKSYLILKGEEILFQQNKHCDYKYYLKDEPVYEDINAVADQIKNIHLLHIEGLGRICIIICYDYLDTAYRDQLMKNLCPTLVCSPSFSTGSFNFEILAESYFHQGCNWIWCNTCSAANETDREQNFRIIGLMTTLNKNCDLSRPDTLKTICAGKVECKKETCGNCIYYADIPLETQL